VDTGPLIWEKRLFLGVTGFLVLLFWAGRVLRTKGKVGWTPGFYLGLVWLFFILSLGMSWELMGHRVVNPVYWLFFKGLPGFASMRVPARIAVMVAFGVAILMGYLLSWLSQKVRTPLLQVFGSLFICMVVLLEHLSLPVTLAPNRPFTPPEVLPPAYQWLSQQPDKLPLLELPFGQHWVETKYMYFSTYHFQRLVNGYSGYAPDVYQENRRLLSQFPEEPALAQARKLSLKYVLLHKKALPHWAERAALVQPMIDSGQLLVISENEKTLLLGLSLQQ